MGHFALSLLLLMISPVADAATVLPVDNLVSKQQITDHLEFRTDDEQKLNPTTVRSVDDWQILRHRQLSDAHRTYWFRFSLANRSARFLHLLLEIDNGYLDYVNLYQFRGAELVSEVRRRKSMPMAELGVPQRGFSLPISLQPGHTYEFYLKSSSARTMEMPVVLWSEAGYDEQLRTEVLTLGGFLGVFVLVFFYNLVIYATIRHRALLAFAGFIFFFALFQVSALGFGPEFFWSEHHWLSEFTTIVGVALSITFASWFTLVTLDVEELGHVYVRLLEAFIVLSLGLAFGYPILTHKTALLLLYSLAIPSALVVWLVALMGAVKNDRLSIYFTVSWSALIVGIVALTFSRLGILPLTLFTQQAPFIGFVVMLLLMTASMAAEINRRRQDYQQMQLGAERQARVRQEELNAELEEMVRSRTGELETALKELSDANATLKQISTIDSLTNIHNRHYFDDIFAQEWKRATREKYPLTLMLLDIDHFKGVNDSYGHLAGDECLRHVALLLRQALRRPADILARYGGEEFVILLPYVANDNGIRLAEQVREEIERMVISVDVYDIQLTMSIGLSTVVPADEDEPKDLIAAADLALYKAKDGGRNLAKNAGNLRSHKST